MRFLLDTCVVSDFAQGQPLVLARVKTAAPEDLAASAITEMEVAYGLLLNPKLAGRLKPVMDAFFGAIRVLPYDRAAAEATARARANLKLRGADWGLRRFNRGSRARARVDSCYLERARVQTGRGTAHRGLAVIKSRQDVFVARLYMIKIARVLAQNLLDRSRR
jgi:tRNA(fMet)-specific endonuclease VapC